MAVGVDAVFRIANVCVRCFACAWLHEAELRVKEIVPVVSHDETDQVHCGPGPFSMAGPDMVSEMLQIAGFESICFERYDADICVGRTLEDAIEFSMALGLAGNLSAWQARRVKGAGRR